MPQLFRQLPITAERPASVLQQPAVQHHANFHLKKIDNLDGTLFFVTPGGVPPESHRADGRINVVEEQAEISAFRCLVLLSGQACAAAPEPFEQRDATTQGFPPLPFLDATCTRSVKTGRP